MPNLTQLARWLNPRRIRIHGLLLAVCLWSVYAVDLSTSGLRDRAGLIKGTDFLHFYVLGTLARSGQGNLLYDIPAQTVLTGNLLPQARGTVYVPLYGPQVSLLFAPLAHLPYGWALTLWLLLNAAIYALCCYAIWRQCSHLQGHRWDVLVLAAAFPGFFHLLAWGQTSGLALACFTLAFLELSGKRQFIAGVAIGALIFKPQLGLAAAVVFVLAGEWKVVLGAIIGAAAELALGWMHYGTAIMRNYGQALMRIRDVLPWLEPRPYQMHSFRAFWSLLVPWPTIAFALYLVCGILVLGIAFRMWTSGASLALRYSALLFATVLVSPHLTVYDLAILAPAFLLLADWLAASSDDAASSQVKLLLYLCYPLFLLGPLARYTHLQLSVLAMAALLWILPASLPHSSEATLITP
jgi:hypothetical protein